MSWFCLISVSVIYVDFSVQLSKTNNIITIHTINFLIPLCLSTNLHSKIQFKAISPCSITACSVKSPSGFLAAPFRYWRAVVRAPQNLLFSKLKASAVPNIAISVLKLCIFFFFLTLSYLISG